MLGFLGLLLRSRGLVRNAGGQERLRGAIYVRVRNEWIQCTQMRCEQTFSTATMNLWLLCRTIARYDALNTMINLLEHVKLMLKTKQNYDSFSCWGTDRARSGSLPIVVGTKSSTKKIAEGRVPSSPVLKPVTLMDSNLPHFFTAYQTISFRKIARPSLRLFRLTYASKLLVPFASYF